MAIQPLSPAFVVKLLQEKCDDHEVLLITIKHDSWEDDLRLTTTNKQFLRYHPENNLPMTGIVSNGKEYQFAGIDVVLPDSSNEKAPEAKITFSNVDQTLSRNLMLIDAEYPTIDLQLVLFSEPDFVEIEYLEMFASRASWNSPEGEIVITSDTGQNEPSPPHTFNTLIFPALREY